VTLVRQWINGSTEGNTTLPILQYLTFNVVSNGVFNVTPNANVTIPPNITMTRTNSSSNATLSWISSFNFTGTTPYTPYVPLEGLGRETLFLTETPSNGTATLTSVLGAIQNNSFVADQVAFLEYSSKALAGGWRFLTYFGASWFGRKLHPPLHIMLTRLSVSGSSFCLNVALIS